jgi:hypothetical protein
MRRIAELGLSPSGWDPCLPEELSHGATRLLQGSEQKVLRRERGTGFSRLFGSDLDESLGVGGVRQLLIGVPSLAVSATGLESLLHCTDVQT